MSDTLDTTEVVNALSNMTVMELCALTHTLEDKWGVKATAPAAPIGTVQPEPLPVETQSEFKVVLTGFPPDKKMTILKLVREVTGLGLKEAKDFVESVPKTVKSELSKTDAEELSTRLKEAGAEVVME